MLSGLRLECVDGAEPKLSIASYGYKVSGRVEVSADVTDPGVALVNGRLLVDIARSLPAQPVDVEIDGTRLRVRCGRGLLRAADASCGGVPAAAGHAGPQR